MNIGAARNALLNLPRENGAMRAVPFILAVASLVSGLAAPAAAHQIEGSAAAIDGDTLDMTGTRVRLAHIDAPEARQGCETDGELWACGKEAGTALASLVAGQTVSCRTLARDVYGREVAVCQTRLFDLGEEMLRRGMAIATDGAPQHYSAVEGLAKRQREGIWASDFQLPAQWRAANLQPPQQQHSPPLQTASQGERRGAQAGSPGGSLGASRGETVHRNTRGCAIKGNRNRKGEWIYHLPGRPYYNQTRAEELFCTESEARAAGYRRSRA